jgi:hypothetical protein
MYTSADINSAQLHWTLARLLAEIRHLAKNNMGAEEAARHLVKLAHIVFLLCAFFGRGPERIRVRRIFQVDVRTITRRIGVPTSPALVREMVDALDLLRKHALSLGYFVQEEPVLRHRGPYWHEVEDWIRWAPAYLPKIDPHCADQPGA